MYRVETTPEFDRAVVRRIIRRVEWMAEHPEALSFPLRHLPDDMKGLH